MTQQFTIMDSGDYFIAHNSGVQIANDALCSHGQAAIFLVLFGRHRSQTERAEQRLPMVMPRCVLTEAIGAIQAQILRDEGEASLRQFIDDVAAYAAETSAALEQLHAARRDCCEAGFRTNGSEHTCGRDAQK